MEILKSQTDLISVRMMTSTLVEVELLSLKIRERFIENKKEKPNKCLFCPYTYLHPVKTKIFPDFLFLCVGLKGILRINCEVLTSEQKAKLDKRLKEAGRVLCLVMVQGSHHFSLSRNFLYKYFTLTF